MYCNVITLSFELVFYYTISWHCIQITAILNFHIPNVVRLHNMARPHLIIYFLHVLGENVLVMGNVKIPLDVILVYVYLIRSSQTLDFLIYLHFFDLLYVGVITLTDTLYKK